MADQDLQAKPLTFQVAIGIDESTQDLAPSLEWRSLSGLIPVFHDVHQVKIPGYPQDDVEPNQGALQRITGKKLIDANPNQKVFAICQAFNGFGQFGYFVQTDQKLYFHTCESPKDMHINFANLQDLGVDSNGFSLDIFGHPPSSSQATQDDSISCLFQFPSGDKPNPPNAGHPGLDYVIIQIFPLDNRDFRLRSRITSLNSGTGYDNNDVGFYRTQNACRFDSIPLVSGTDGSQDYPPTNSKTAYLGWGGNLFNNVWTLHAGASSNVWTQVADAWQQISPPVFSFVYRGYIQQNLGGGPSFDSAAGSYAQFGSAPGQRIFYQSRIDNRGIDSGTNYWIVTSSLTPSGANKLQGSSGPTISFVSGGFPAATNSGRFGLIGTTFYQDVQYLEDSAPSWQEPKSASYGSTWKWGNASTRENDPVSGTQSNLNKIGYQSDTQTYWKLTKISTWTYANFTAMQNSSHTQADLAKYARETDNNTWWALSQAGNQVTVAYTYPDQATMQNASGFLPADIGKIAHELDNNTYWTLTSFNRHAVNTNLSEFYFINLNRLFTDNQNITPVSIAFMIKGYWDKAHGGSGQVRVIATTFQGGLVTRTDSVVWGIQSGTQVATAQLDQPCTLVAIDGDVKGNNIVQVTVTMTTGAVAVTAPAPNADGATPCPF